MDGGPVLGKEGEEVMDGHKAGTKPTGFYMVSVTDDGKILWRGMTMTHIKDLSEEQRREVIEEIRRLKEQGLGRRKIQKAIAETMSVYVPRGVLRKLIEGNGKIDWKRCGLQGPRRDLQLRKTLYARVKELMSEGKGCKDIQEMILKEFGVRVSQGQIYNWCRDIFVPENNLKEIPLTSDTWWFLGLFVADGNPIIGYGDNYLEYKLKLATKDEEIVQKVKTALPGYSYVRKDRRNGTLNLVVKSRELYERFYKVQRLIGEGKYDELIQIMGDEGTKAFVRGLFDGDGSGLFTHITNNDVNILEFFRYALKGFTIETSQPILVAKKGTVRRGPNNHWIVVKRDIYCVFVYPEDYEKFFGLIGSSLQRKSYHMRLSQKILQEYSRKYGRTYLEEVRRRYEKGENWVDVLMPLMKGVGASLMRKRRK